MLNVILGASVRNSGSVSKPYMVTFGGIACSGWTPAKTIDNLGSYHPPFPLGHTFICLPFPQKRVSELRREQKRTQALLLGSEDLNPHFPSSDFGGLFCCRGCSGSLLLHQLWQAGAALAPVCGTLTAGFSGSGAWTLGPRSCSSQALERTLSSCGVWA